VIDLWPEEDSLASKLGRVFDEAIRPHKTGQEIADEILDLAASLHAKGKPVPEAHQRVERQHVLDKVMSSDPGCAWLHKRRPLGRLEELVEHWRGCATCQGVARAELQAHLARDDNGRGRTYGG
jgi:hypothetical protein